MIYLIIYLMIGLIYSSVMANSSGAFKYVGERLVFDIICFVLFLVAWPMALLLWVLRKSGI
jgi:hypothetical protein